MRALLQARVRASKEKRRRRQVTHGQWRAPWLLASLRRPAARLSIPCTTNRDWPAAAVQRLTQHAPTCSLVANTPVRSTQRRCQPTFVFESIGARSARGRRQVILEKPLLHGLNHAVLAREQHAVQLAVLLQLGQLERFEVAIVRGVVLCGLVLLVRCLFVVSRNRVIRSRRHFRFLLTRGGGGLRRWLLSGRQRLPSRRTCASRRLSRRSRRGGRLQRQTKPRIEI